MTAKITAVLLLLVSALFAGPASAETSRHWRGLKKHGHVYNHHKHFGRHAHSHRAGVRQARRHARPSGKRYRAAGASGIASVYAYRAEPTANGERAHPGGLTAAHKTLPFGSRVQVINTRNGRSVVVRINDRGPFIAGRVIDLTPAGAHVLGFSGLAPVKLAVLR